MMLATSKAAEHPKLIFRQRAYRPIGPQAYLPALSVVAG